MKLKKYYVLFLGLCLTLLAPLAAEASGPIPTLNRGTGPSFDEQMSSWTNQINSYAPTISFLFNAVFTIMFLIGVVKLGYSFVTKTGHVMKLSTGLLIWAPISFFFIRLLIIMMFTTTSKNVTLLASEMIHLIQSTVYYTSIGIILIGLVLFMFYRFIDHPEYSRWSKRLWAISLVLTLLATITPFVLGAS